MHTAVGEVTWTLDRRRGPHRPSAKCDRSLPLSTARDTRGRPRNGFVSIPSCRRLRWSRTTGSRPVVRRCSGGSGAGWRPAPRGPRSVSEAPAEESRASRAGLPRLRFLAEDVGKELDSVLDAVLRALSHRRSFVATAPLNLVKRDRP